MQKKKQQKYKQGKNRKALLEKSDSMLKGNVLLEKAGWILTLTLAAEFLLIVVLHVMVNSLIRFCKGHLSDCFSWSCLTTFYPALMPFYILALMAAVAVAVLNVYRFRNAFRSLEAGQKGSSRFTTMEEIREQYPAVAEMPEKNPDGSIRRIPGDGGLPVASRDGYMYLDESATNTLILAITRAGKGEVFSIRMLDSYSRSEKQPSLIILDMKFDLRKMCTKAFQDRGYEVMSINLENPMHGVGYNPLYLITRYYQEGKDSEAELLCKSFAYPHFASAKGKSDDNSDFFLTNATSALTATIMAHTVDCLRHDKRENARLAMIFLSKRMLYERLEGAEKEKADKEYDQLEKEKTFSECICAAKVVPDVAFKMDDRFARKNNMASVINLFTNLSSESAGRDKTRLDEYFDLRGKYDRARAVYTSIGVSGDKTKGGIFSQMLTKLNQYTFGGMEQMTRESTFSPEELGFGKKPIALFLQVPFYDRSKDAIAMSIIDQLYQANARACGQSRSGKCDRRIIFHLDEVAQFPPIENLDSKLSICLGLNMVFNLIIQTDAQLTFKYGEAAKIIKGNCGNQVYLQTSEEETAKLFSSLLGSKTITDVSRAGTRFSLNKSYTEAIAERPLLNPRELMDLEEGENVVLRTMYRRDLKGNQIKPRPIFNSRKEGRAFLYRYQYLQDYFPDADTVSEESLHLPTLKAVKENELMYDYTISFEAVRFSMIPKQLEKLEKQLQKLADEGENEEQMNQLDNRYKELEEQRRELAKKQLYQWDMPIQLVAKKKSATHEKQFVDLCKILGSMDRDVNMLLEGGCTAGELLVQVTVSNKIPLDKKGNLLAHLKAQAGLL